jgi:hypothetical protein
LDFYKGVEQMAAGAVVAAGTAVDIYAARKASKANIKALEAQAGERERSAAEVLERFELKAEMDRMETGQLVGVQKNMFSKGGVDIGTGTPLLAAEEAMRLNEKAISLSSRETKFQVGQLMREADAERQAVKDEKKAFKLRALGSVLQAGAMMTPKK